MFNFNVVQALLDSCGINHRRTVQYRPQQNGRVERTNQDLGRVRSIFTSEDQFDRDEHIDDIVHAMNTAKSIVTKFTPHFLIFGSEACEVVDHLMLKLQDLDALPLST